MGHNTKYNVYQVSCGLVANNPGFHPGNITQAQKQFDVFKCALIMLPYALELLWHGFNQTFSYSAQ